MHLHQTNGDFDTAAAFARSLAARRAIGHAIERASHAHQATIRIVPMQPERKTWYECTTCGCAGTTTWGNQRHCARCGALALRRDWVRPDIAAAERRAWFRRRRWRARREAERHTWGRSTGRWRESAPPQASDARKGSTPPLDSPVRTGELWRFAKATLNEHDGGFRGGTP